MYSGVIEPAATQPGAPEPSATQPGAPSLLLGPAEIRVLASASAVRPTKRLGQNFLHDANTIRRIVRIAGVHPGVSVLEVGPGLGSLTFGLIEAGAFVTAVEIDSVLAASVAASAGRRGVGDRLTVVQADALTVAAADIEALPVRSPELLVANLPYNVSVPVLLHLLETFPALRSALVLVQAEVGARLAAAPGSRVYGVPSVKAAWYADVTLAGTVPRSVFWPVPNVDSVLVRLVRRPTPPLPHGLSRRDVFAVVDAAFAQRRKMLRSALADRAGSPAAASQALERAGVDPTARGETVNITGFIGIAAQLAGAGAPPE